MKKSIAFLLVLMLLTGCSNNDSQSTKSTTDDMVNNKPTPTAEEIFQTIKDTAEQIGYIITIDNSGELPKVIITNGIYHLMLDVNNDNLIDDDYLNFAVGSDEDGLFTIYMPKYNGIYQIFNNETICLYDFRKEEFYDDVNNSFCTDDTVDLYESIKGYYEESFKYWADNNDYLLLAFGQWIVNNDYQTTLE